MIRRITPTDVDTVLTMVHGLAEYEKAADRCHLTAGQLHTALFGEHPALFGHVAEAADGVVVGLALWFLNYSTWDGVHGVYLEDLYVRPEHRGVGHGRGLLAALAGVSTSRGYSRLTWSVLRWNTPSIGFYRSLGAEDLLEWTTMRLSGPDLSALAADPSGQPADALAAD